MTEPRARQPSEGAARWLAVFTTASDRIAAALRDMPPAERRLPQGAGAGGDVTVLADRVAEDILLEELERHAPCPGLTVVTEEAGVLDLGAPAPLVVLDPIDGSLNAMRGLALFATSIALADGTTMADVSLGFVHDYATGTSYVAERGRGAWADGRPLLTAPAPPERPPLVVVEGASPHRVAAAAATMVGSVGRIRVFGSLALSICAVASGSCDAMVGLGGARAVDTAAAQLVALEAGALVGMPEVEDLPGTPLDVSTRRWTIAARDEDTFALMRAALEATR